MNDSTQMRVAMTGEGMHSCSHLASLNQTHCKNGPHVKYSETAQLISTKLVYLSLVKFVEKI